MHRSKLGLVGLTMLLLGAHVAPAAADICHDRYGYWQHPGPCINRSHAYIGARGVGMLILDQSTDYTDGYLGNGGGFGLFAGFKLGPVAALEFNWDATWHNETLRFEDADVVLLDSLYLMTFTGDLKLHFPTPSIVDPFILVGGGYARLGASYTSGFDFDSTFADGAAFETGGGLNIWVSPYLSVGGQIFYRGIWFSAPDYDPRWPRYDNFVSGLVFDADLTIHF